MDSLQIEEEEQGILQSFQRPLRVDTGVECAYWMTVSHMVLRVDVGQARLPVGTTRFLFYPTSLYIVTCVLPTLGMTELRAAYLWSCLERAVQASQ